MERYQPWLVAVVAARLLVERLVTVPRPATGAGTVSIEPPLAAEAFDVLREAVALLSAAPAVPVREAESARQDALDALGRAALVFSHPSRPPGPVRDLLARADRALVSLGECLAPRPAPPAPSSRRLNRGRRGAHPDVVELVRIADQCSPREARTGFAWEHPTMPADRSDAYASFRRQITERVAEVGRRIEQLRDRRAELAGGKVSTEDDVARAAAAAVESKQHADAAHARAAEALEAAARAHERAAAKDAAKASAHEQAARADRARAARHQGHLARGD
jgi:hypothetical protein